MPDRPARRSLESVLGDLRSRGAIGTTSVAAAMVHARRYLRSVPDRSVCGHRAVRLADLGSGGGLPGLVIAHDRPDLSVTLVERRQNRADQLRRAVTALCLEDRVVVFAEDVARLVDLAPGTFDVVTSRRFGPPAIVARWAQLLLCIGGRVLVSEPPPDRGEDRWVSVLRGTVGFGDGGTTDGIRCIIRCS